MLVKTGVLVAMAALPAVSLALPPTTGLSVTLSIGAYSVVLEGDRGPDFRIDATCFATPCPLAELRFERSDRTPGEPLPEAV
ncbi:hypothetical protein [Maricaulis virginensis]|uniref:Uncharacterized protein n=1 Tax=Maricaulis virginensis TaxID=144022 RepID=A0A9W6INA2_9PROT|nr:hypothetical protein [Maricaulis virginensis]GLK52642.1 hypothetical protein GCM10017621_21500 [Maricaulis virginensis]